MQETTNRIFKTGKTRWSQGIQAGLYIHARESLCPRVHARVGSRVHMHICKITIMHAYASGQDCACIAWQQSQWAHALYKQKHTLPHMHASPRSNDSGLCLVHKHPPSDTCIHCLTEITMSMRLIIHAHTHTSTYTHRQSSLWAYALSTRSHTKAHTCIASQPLQCAVSIDLTYTHINKRIHA